MRAHTSIIATKKETTVGRTIRLLEVSNFFQKAVQTKTLQLVTLCTEILLSHRRILLSLLAHAAHRKKLIIAMNQQSSSLTQNIILYWLMCCDPMDSFTKCISKGEEQ